MRAGEIDSISDFHNTVLGSTAADGSGRAKRDAIGRDIENYNRSCADNAVFTDVNAGDNDRTNPNECTDADVNVTGKSNSGREVHGITNDTIMVNTS